MPKPSVTQLIVDWRSVHPDARKGICDEIATYVDDLSKPGVYEGTAAQRGDEARANRAALNLLRALGEG